MDSIKWKYLVRSVMRGKNILIVGPTGCGKTLAAQTVAKALERPYFYFNPTLHLWSGNLSICCSDR